MDNPAALSKLKAALESELQALESLREIADSGASTVELDQSKVGRLSRMDAMQQQAMQKEQNRRRDLRFEQIKAALRRMEEQDYGWCLDCGEAIKPERLAVNPAAAYCTQCADKH